LPQTSSHAVQGLRGQLLSRGMMESWFTS
jgi:hypothetical protein